jgi:hypothetical protein
MHTGFRWENQKERDHYEDLDVGWRIISKRFLNNTGGCGLDSSGSHDKWAVLNMIKFWVHKMLIILE